MSLGDYLILHGTMPVNETGTVSIDGSFDGSTTWYSLATVPARNSSYTARIKLTHVGVLRLRVTKPDGSTAEGAVTVTP